MKRLNATPSPPPVVASSAQAAAPSQSSQNAGQPSARRQKTHHTLDLPARPTALNPPQARALRFPAGTLQLPNDVLKGITPLVKGKSTVALARTSRHMLGIVAPELDSARLVDRAEQAGSARELEPLYDDTPDDPPRAGRVHGQPNAIARLADDQQDEPKAAATEKLASLSRQLGAPGNDSLHDVNVFNDINYLFQNFETISDEEKLPVLEILAAKSASIDGYPGNMGGHVHYEIALMVQSLPIELQPELWKSLARNVVELSQEEVPAAFDYMLATAREDEHHPALRIELLTLITPALTLFDPQEQLARCDALVQAAQDVPDVHPEPLHDRMLTYLARSTVEPMPGRIDAVLPYMLNLAGMHGPSHGQATDMLASAFAAAIGTYDPSQRADVAAWLIDASAGLPEPQRTSVQTRIRETVA